MNRAPSIQQIGWLSSCVGHAALFGALSYWSGPAPAQRASLAGHRATAHIELASAAAEPFFEPIESIEYTAERPLETKQQSLEASSTSLADLTRETQPLGLPELVISTTGSEPVGQNGNPLIDHPLLQHAPSTKPDRATTPPPAQPVAAVRPRSAGADEQTPVQLLHNPPPRYPQSAIARRLEGRVMLEVSIAATGQVVRVEVLDSSGHPTLDQAAVTAVQQWRFKPARRGATAVDSQARLPVRFHL